jgi:hypothetical protein
MLEVSAPRGATERQVRRRGRLSLVFATLAAALMVSAVAGGAVWTDEADYHPGDVVTISGDNSDGVGFLAGEAVRVDVTGPNGYTASCDAVADENGAWSCQVTLWDDARAEGSYSYTATGQTSGISQSGAFTDNNIGVHNVRFNATGLPGATNVTVTGSSPTPGGSHAGTAFSTTFATPANSANIGATVSNVTVGTHTHGAFTFSFSLPTSFSGVGGSYNLTTIAVTAGSAPVSSFAASSSTGNGSFTTGAANTGAGGVPTTVTGTYVFVPSNTIPAVSFTGGPTSVNESSTDEHTYTFSITDPDAGDSWSFVSGYPTCGTGGALVAGSANVDNALKTGSFKCKFDDGLTPPTTAGVAVQVEDAASEESNVASRDVSVANVAPSGTFNAPSSVNEGSSFNLSFSGVTDPSSADTTAGFQFKFDCGAGYGAYGASDSATCNTATDGPATLAVKGMVKDKDDGEREYTGSVDVLNVAPTVAAQFTALSVDCQTTATLTIDPDDVGVNDSPWTVDIDWGDGSTEPSISRSNLNSFTVTHVYALAGVYNAMVSVTDKDDDTGSDNTNGITINQTYTVDFRPPFDDSSPSGLIVNRMKNGRVVPVKSTIYDDCGEAYLTDPASVVTVKVSKTSGSGSGDPVEEYADAGESSAGTNMFRWTSDLSAPGGGFWIYNLDSKYLGLIVNNLYRVDIYVGTVKATTTNWAVLQPVK